MTLAQSEPPDRSIPELRPSSNPLVFHLGLKDVEVIGYTFVVSIAKAKMRMFTEFAPLSGYNSSLLHTRLKIYHRIYIPQKQHGGHNFNPVPT
jgi:hypothetical protein